MLVWLAAPGCGSSDKRDAVVTSPTAAAAGRSGAGEAAGSGAAGRGGSSAGRNASNRAGRESAGEGGEGGTGSASGSHSAGEGAASGDDADRGGTASGRGGSGATSGTAALPEGGAAGEGDYHAGRGGRGGSGATSGTAALPEGGAAGEGAEQSGAAGASDSRAGMGGEGGDASEGGAAGAPAPPCCDDGNACTLDICDETLGCRYESATRTTEYVGEEPIIDDPTNTCFVLATEEVIVSVNLTDPGVVGELGVTVDFLHDWIGDLDVEISHLNTKAFLVHLSPDGTGINGGKARGAYTFRDGAPTLPMPMNGRAIPPGSYAPNEPLSAFRGKPVAGTWTLRIADHCPFDGGTFRAFSVQIAAACEGADGCRGLCSAGVCGCN